MKDLRYLHLLKPSFPQSLMLIIVLSLFSSCEFSTVCDDNLIFPDPETSDYVLLYPVGTSSELFQAYCNKRGHRGRLAYDFKFPFGATITAARAGKVIVAIGTYRDNDHTPGHNNRVVIRHSDSTLAWYAHLEQHSVGVEVGEMIEVGDTLGLCGLSGRSGKVPHLHFEVFKTNLYDYDDADPISFRNVSGEVDEKGMLIPGKTYLALK